MPETKDGKPDRITAEVIPGEALYRSDVVKAYEEAGGRDADQKSTDEMAKAALSPFERRLNLRKQDAEVRYKQLFPGVSANYRLTGKRMVPKVHLENYIGFPIFGTNSTSGSWWRPSAPSPSIRY